MKLFSLSKMILTAAMAATLSTLAAAAAQINVPNASFETPASPAQTSTNSNVVSGWVFSVQGGSSFGTESIPSNFASPGASLGSSAAFINDDYPNVTDTLTSAASLGAIKPNTSYTLTLAVGNHNGTGLYNDPGNVSFSLLANGVAFATQTVNNGTVPNGTFEDFTLSYTTPSAAPIIGENLTIQLAALPEHGNAFQPAFDNITLDATTIVAAPEPATSILLIVGGIAVIGLARLRRGNCKPFNAGLAIVSVAAIGMASASADPIEVPNFSFETSPWTGWTYTHPDILSGWTFDAPAGSGYGSLLYQTTFTSPNLFSGQEYAFIDNDSPGEGSTLTSATPLGTIAANTTYTLTVALGNPDGADTVPPGNPFSFDPMAEVPMGGTFLSLLADGQPFAIDSLPADLVAGGTWQDFSLSYTTTDSDPIVGQQLTIQLGTEPGEGASEGSSFDNVRLVSTANDALLAGGIDSSGGEGTAPEPPVFALLGLGGLALGCLMRWRGLNSEFSI